MNIIKEIETTVTSPVRIKLRKGNSTKITTVIIAPNIKDVPIFFFILPSFRYLSKKKTQNENADVI